MAHNLEIVNGVASYAENGRKERAWHGLGKVFHAPPNILHFGKPGKGTILEEGMFFTVEPMINVGKPDTILNKADGWTVTTRDKTLSAQFEHSIAVTKDGFEIFSLSPSGKHCPPFSA